MQQGDQYSIMFAIKKAGEPLTPDDVEGVRVHIGGIERRYPDGGLDWDAESRTWLFPVSQSETLQLRGLVAAQVQVDFGGSPRQIVGSTVERFRVDESVIRRVWDE